MKGDSGLETAAEKPRDQQSGILMPAAPGAHGRPGVLAGRTEVNRCTPREQETPLPRLSSLPPLLSPDSVPSRLSSPGDDNPPWVPGISPVEANPFYTTGHDLLPLAVHG